MSRCALVRGNYFLALLFSYPFPVWLIAGDRLLSVTKTVVPFQCAKRTCCTYKILGPHACQYEGQTISEAWIQFTYLKDPPVAFGYVYVSERRRVEVVLAARTHCSSAASTGINLWSRWPWTRGCPPGNLEHLEKTFFDESCFVVYAAM